MTSDIQNRSPRSPLAWGVFLATSWTWCIGMFLPVLLVHDFGFWGWLVFAIPNIIGAGAMGWMLRDAEQSERMVCEHRAACVAFSVVTILFHLYFLAWFVMQLLDASMVMAIAMPLAICLWIWMRTDRRNIGTAAAVYAFSLAAFVIVLMVQGLPRWSAPALPPVMSQRGVLWLIPVCCLGFFTCPYLDLTFHRARQATTSAGGKMAFGAGFGIFFLVMILFTLCYAQRIYHWLFAMSIHENHRPDLIICLVAAHMIIQSVFTIAAHARLILPAQSFSVPTALLIAYPFVLVWGLMGFGTLLLSIRFPAAPVMIYLLFMSFYALAVPAYLCCNVRRRTGWFFVLPVLLAAPFYWLGFFQNWTIWLLPGVAIVLIAAIIARYSGSNAASARSESRPARQESML